MDATNLDRACWAAAALAEFRKQVRSDDDDTTAIGDLLADLMHYADAHGADFDAAFASGLNHYAEEVMLEQERGAIDPDGDVLEPTNQERAGRAEKALDEYQHHLGEAGPHDQQRLGDLLSDLMHYARSQEWFFETALGDARRNHREEVAQERTIAK